MCAHCLDYSNAKLHLCLCKNKCRILHFQKYNDSKQRVRVGQGGPSTRLLKKIQLSFTYNRSCVLHSIVDRFRQKMFSHLVRIRRKISGQTETPISL